MSHGVARYTKSDIQKIVEAEPFRANKLFKASLFMFVLVGALSFLQGIIAGGDAKVHSWMSLHVNFMFWFGLAAASSGFAAVFHICNAQWSRGIKRIFESAFPFLFISPLFIVILYFGAYDLFEWARHPVHGKEMWLSPLFLYARNFVGVCLLIWCFSIVIRSSLGIDITAIRKGLVTVGKERPAYSRWMNQEFSSCEAEGVDSEKSIRGLYDRMSRFSPVCVIVYACAMSLIAFDFLMSVDPHWYSTMFGGFYFMSSVYAAVAFVSFIAVFLAIYHPVFKSAIKRKVLHDLGKLLFGFGIFWAYLFWSHYLPIWYGNLPEETGYIILRLREYPWRSLAWLILGMCFIVPFFLGLSRDLKQVPALLSLTGLIVLLGLWLQYYLLFAPGIYPSSVEIIFRDVGVALGFLGLFSLGVLYYLEKYPLIPFGDLLIDTSDHYLRELDRKQEALRG
jgi:hypothetical protein